MSNLSRKHTSEIKNHLDWVLETVEDDLNEEYIGLRDIKVMLRYAERLCEDLRYIAEELEEDE